MGWSGSADKIRISDCARKAHRVAGGTSHKRSVGPSVRRLRVGHIHFLFRLGVEAKVLHVPHNAHDAVPRVPIRIAEVDSPPQRFTIGPQQSGHSLVYDSNRRCRSLVTALQRPSTEQRNFQRSKVSGSDEAIVYGGFQRAGGSLSFDCEHGAIVATGQWESIHDRRRLDTRERLDLANRLQVEGGSLLRITILQRGERNVQTKHAFRLKPRVDSRQSKKTLDQKTRSDRQNQGKRQLGND